MGVDDQEEDIAFDARRLAHDANETVGECARALGGNGGRAVLSRSGGGGVIALQSVLPSALFPALAHALELAGDGDLPRTQSQR